MVIQMSDRILRSCEYRKLAGNISPSTEWRWVRQGIFPKPEKIGPNLKGLRESVFQEWLDGRRDWK